MREEDDGLKKAYGVLVAARAITSHLVVIGCDTVVPVSEKMLSDGCVPKEQDMLTYPLLLRRCKWAYAKPPN